MEFTLETPRMVLRRFTPNDAPLLHALDADPEVMRYLSGGTPTPPALIETDILPAFIASSADGRGYWAAHAAEGGAFLGWFGLRPPADPALREAELGYRLRREAWGRGFASEGVAALVAHAFGTLALVHLTATTYEENAASRRVLEKAGFTLHRRFRLSAADVAAPGTFVPGNAEPWPGDDLEYLLSNPGRHQR
ncbi:MAG: GNAT family N-acetyltransferase [Thermoflexaceae bacterium]|nr:GNAT family N-acetyltransferase [Thermoflexaceae bacterium]